MSNKKKNKIRKPNVQMTESEKQKKEELKEATSDFKAKVKAIKNNTAIAILLDVFKLMLVLLIIDLAIVIIPAMTTYLGAALGISETSTTADLIIWQACSTFGVLCDFYIMVLLIKKIIKSLSLPRFRKGEK